MWKKGRLKYMRYNIRKVCFRSILPSTHFLAEKNHHFNMQGLTPLLDRAARSPDVSPKSFGCSTLAPKTMRALISSRWSFCGKNIDVHKKKKKHTNIDTWPIMLHNKNMIYNIHYQRFKGNPHWRIKTKTSIADRFQEMEIAWIVSAYKYLHL